MDYNEKHYDMLDFISQKVFNEQKFICENCTGIDTCKQKAHGMQPYIDKVTDSYVIFYKPCPKRRGYLKSYVDIKVYNNLYKNDNRKIALEHLFNYKGGFIYGEPGNGKSYTFSFLANEINKTGKSVYYDLSNNIIQAVWDFKTRTATLKELQEYDFLFIDDFGGEKLTEDIILTCWIPVIKSRVDNKKPLYISSNYSLQELAERISSVADTMTAKVIIDRIESLGAICFKDKDYRRGV